jgi:hypothetical protein
MGQYLALIESIWLLLHFCENTWRCIQSRRGPRLNGEQKTGTRSRTPQKEARRRKMKALLAAAFSALIAVSLTPALSSAQSGQALLDNQDVQAARENQDVQAPRENQDVQAPRENQDVQAPRTEMTPSGVSTHAPMATGPSSSVSR